MRELQSRTPKAKQTPWLPTASCMSTVSKPPAALLSSASVKVELIWAVLRRCPFLIGGRLISIAPRSGPQGASPAALRSSRSVKVKLIWAVLRQRLFLTGGRPISIAPRSGPQGASPAALRSSASADRYNRTAKSPGNSTVSGTSLLTGDGGCGILHVEMICASRSERIKTDDSEIYRQITE